MTSKYCTSCCEEKDIEDFHWKDKAKNIQCSSCRSCVAVRNKQHYMTNKQVYISKARHRNLRIYDENRKHLCDYLSVHPCIDCGCNDIRVLEFDHVRGIKVDEVSRLLSKRTSWNTIEAEIAKCEVRCANCHRIKTNERGGFWRDFPGF
jgi:hypothetical protein